jgi:hypothetical protein
MNNYDVKRLALVLSIQAEIEGMKAENIQREAQRLAQAYGDEQFQYMAEELRNMAAKHDEQL